MKKLFLIFLFATFSCCAIAAQGRSNLLVKFPIYALTKPEKLIRNYGRPFNLRTGISTPTGRPWPPYNPQLKEQNGNKNGPKKTSNLKASERYKGAEVNPFWKIEKNHMCPPTLSEYGNIINSASKSLERGFILEEHNIVSPNVSSVQEEGTNEVQIEDSSQKWKEKLREKVLDKIHKINKIETKGNIYMIYGHIIKKYYDGECYINDAA